MTRAQYNPSLHRLAVLTAAATFPLIFMGGLVTSHGAGMSVPDWPNTYGYNLFTFPPSRWVGGIFYEHTHRLMGALVGLLAIALAALAWRVERRPWARRLTFGVLGAVILQGTLGGLRVLWVNLDLAVVHACLAQAFFCLATLVAIVTSKWWHEIGDDAADRDPALADPRLTSLAIVATVVVFAQLVIGALMRHYEAGLAIPDLPLAYGQVLPPLDAAGLDAANAARIHDLSLRPARVTMGQVWLHFGHRVGALVVSGAVVAACVRVLRRHRRESALARPAMAGCAMLVVQLSLGVLTVLLRKPADIASAHVAVGALTLASCFVLAIRAGRIAQAHAAWPAPGASRTPRGQIPHDQETLPEAAALAGVGS